MSHHFILLCFFSFNFMSTTQRLHARYIYTIKIAAIIHRGDRKTREEKKHQQRNEKERTELGSCMKGLVFVVPFYVWHFPIHCLRYITVQQ